MRGIMINVVGVVSVLLVAECGATLTEQPLNTVAQVGSNVILACSTNSTKKLKWTLDTNENAVYNGYELVRTKCPRCQIVPTTSDTQTDLHILSVELSDAQAYFCLESNEQPASAELVIIESELACRSNATGNVNESQFFELLCFLKFAGNWFPSISWHRVTGGEASEVTATSTVTYDGLSKTLTSRVIIPATRDMNGTQFISNVFFDVSNRSSAVSAGNIPELQKSTWSSDILLVAYGPADVHVVPPSSSESTTFTCSATEVNPAPVFRWINTTSGEELGEGRELDGCGLSSEPKRDVKCIVTNKANGVEKTGVVVFNRNDAWDQLVRKCDERHQEMVVVITVVCIGVVVVIGAFTVVFIILRQPGCSDRSRRNAIPDLVNGHAAPLPAPAAQRQATPSGRRVVPGAAPPPPAHPATLPVLPTAPPPPVAAAAVTAAQSLRDVNANMTNSPRTNAQRDTHSNGGTGINYVTVVGSNHVSDASDGGSSDDDDEDRVDVTQFYMHKDYINLNEAYRPAQAERAAAIASAAGIQPPEDPNYNSDGPIYTSVSSTTSSAAASPRLVTPREQPQYAAIDHSCLQAVNALQTSSQSPPPAAPSSSNTTVDKK